MVWLGFETKKLSLAQLAFSEKSLAQLSLPKSRLGLITNKYQVATLVKPLKILLILNRAQILASGNQMARKENVA